MELMRRLSELRSPEKKLRAKKNIYLQVKTLSDMTLTYSFTDEIIENNQDRKWEKAVDDEI